MGDFSREEIEMFCLARLINCYIDTDPENNFIDWCVLLPRLWKGGCPTPHPCFIFISPWSLCTSLRIVL